ncbi:MAG: hypothetical protein K8E24_012220 [Methanobacterium paludis]|nr:hypothetical protein [Methanobacterium paludis]
MVKRGGKKYRAYMKTDFDMYRKSKPLIPDRTKDYEEYLRRRIAVSNRAELLKLEIEECDARRESLMKEYDLEMELQAEIQPEQEKSVEEIADLVVAIINNLGYIGLDRLMILQNCIKLVLQNSKRLSLRI